MVEEEVDAEGDVSNGFGVEPLMLVPVTSGQSRLGSSGLVQSLSDCQHLRIEAFIYSVDE